MVLNVPLNQDLNYRYFEAMAAGVPQVVVEDPSWVGEHRQLAERPNVFWASDPKALEKLAQQMLARLD